MPKKTEAQRRTQKYYEKRTGYAAQSKYINEKCVKMTFTFSPADADILNRIDTITESKAGYIKRLIREDMERNPRKIPE